MALKVCDAQGLLQSLSRFGPHGNHQCAALAVERAIARRAPERTAHHWLPALEQKCSGPLGVNDIRFIVNAQKLDHCCAMLFPNLFNSFAGRRHRAQPSQPQFNVIPDSSKSFTFYSPTFEIPLRLAKGLAPDAATACKHPSPI